jgi:hypothetical protein
LVPGRTANKASANTIAATAPIITTKVAVSIEASIRWLTDGHEVVAIIALLVVLLMPSFQCAKWPTCQDAKLPSCKTTNVSICQKVKLPSYQVVKSAKLPSCRAAQLLS